MVNYTCGINYKKSAYPHIPAIISGTIQLKFCNTSPRIRSVLSMRNSVLIVICTEVTTAINDDIFDASIKNFAKNKEIVNRW